MGLILFDYQSASSRKKVVNLCLPAASLFDGYLTVLTSFQQFRCRALFDCRSENTTINRHSRLLFNDLFI